MLRLSLRDFATEELSRGLVGLQGEILITSEQLCEFLASAEEMHKMQMQHQGSVSPLRPGILKLHRPQTAREQSS